MPASVPSATRRLSLAVALPLALVLLLGNIVADHFQPPTGLVLTPIVIPLAVGLVAFSRQRRPVVKAVLAAGLISLHDCGIKLYGGALHDAAGQGLIHLGVLVGSLLAFLGLVAALDQQQSSTPVVRRVAKGLFLALLMLHLGLTANLGVGQCVRCDQLL